MHAYIRARWIRAWVCLGFLVGAAHTGAGTLRGQVVSAGGQPVAATIRVVAEPGSGFTIPAVFEVKDDGTFEIPDLDGAVWVRIESTGFAPVVRKSPPLDERLLVRLEVGAGLRGRVVEARSGESIGYATVWVCDDEATPFGFGACAEHATDGGGRFEVSGVPEGGVRLGASSPAHTYKAVEIAAAGVGDAFYRIELEAGAPMVGRVVDDRGEPVAGARIGRDDYRDPFNDSTRVVLDPPLITDANGEFSHPGLKARERGVYRGLLEGWYGAPSGWIVPIRGVEQSVELKLERPAALQFGLVREDGEPARAAVRLTYESYNRLSGPRGSPGADGRYHFEELPTGPLALTLAIEGFQPIDLGEVGLKAGATIDLGDLRATSGLILEGTVLDPDGEPIEAGAIELSYDEPASYRKRIETTSGAFRFEGIPPEVELTLRCTADGFEQLFETLAFEKDAVWDPVLTPLAGIRGRVLQPDGKPALAFTVRALYEDEPRRPEIHQESFDESDGSFFLWPVEPPGFHTVEIVAEGYRKFSLANVAVGDRQVVDVGEIELDLGHRVEGTATKPDGSPAQGARFAASPRSVQRSGNSQEIEGAASGIADDEGRFVVTGLSPGFFTVHAQHPDYAPWSGELRLVEEVSVETLDVEFSAGGVVHGTVRDRGASPIKGIRVGVDCNDFHTQRAETTDERGYYRLTRLPDGQCRATAYTDDGSSFGNARLVAVVRGRESRIDFDLSTAIEVTGVVRIGGQFAPQGGLTFHPSSSFAGGGVVTAGVDSADGRYRVELSEPGEYRVLLQIGNARSFQRLHVPDVRSLQQDFDLPVNGIRGRVIDAAGNPIAGVEVTGSNSRLDLMRTMTTLAISAADGSFELKHLEPGTYVISAGRQGYRRARSNPVELRTDTLIEGLELVLQQSTKRIRGRLIDPRGAGVAEGFVIAAAAGQRRVEFATHASTRPDGSFELDLPADGALDITGLSLGWAAARLTGIVPDDETPITLQATFGGRVAVRVVDGKGEPREGVLLELRAEPEWLASSVQRTFSAPPVSGPDGVAVSGTLPEGTYRVTAPDGASVMVTIYEGQTSDARLTIR